MDTVLKIALIAVVLAAFVLLFGGMVADLADVSGSSQGALGLFMSSGRERYSTPLPFYTPGTMVASFLEPMFGTEVLPGIATAVNAIKALIGLLVAFIFIRKIVAW
jgi:hypothetical protein